MSVIVDKMMYNTCDNDVGESSQIIQFAVTPKASEEAATIGVLCEKVFLEISQNLQENTCVRVSFLIKLWTTAFISGT